MQIRSKQIFTRILALLISVLICVTGIPLTVFAAGGDIENEDDNTQKAYAGYEWLYWLDGVRLTAISSNDGSVAVDSTGNRIASVDWVHNRPGFNSVNYYLPKMMTTESQLCKQDYLRDPSGDPTLNLIDGQYKYKAPPAGMPFIVVDGNDGGADIDAIREYFIKDITVQDYCAHVYGLNDHADYSSSPQAQALFSRLKSGELLLAIEPVIFFNYKSVPYGLTVTETALLDKMTNRDVRAKLANLTNGIAPKSMFLSNTHPKLGYPNPKPAPEASGFYPWEKILNSCLGIGIVWLTPDDATVYHHICNVKLNIPKNAKPLNRTNS